MNLRKVSLWVFGTIASLPSSLHAMQFDFTPLASLCRIEVHLSTGFGSGSVQGTFGRLSGSFQFVPEKPQLSQGKIVMASHSLRFGNPKVAHDAHAPDWLNSSKYPEISFQCKGFKDFAWHGKELRTEAFGLLSIKGIEKIIRIPLSIHYYRGERRKYDGKLGDLLQIKGLVILPRSEFGLAPGSFLGSVMENVEIYVSVTGASERVRPLLPSRLLALNRF
ncbi:MAG: YceI family protein [Opitutae bacterium]